MDEREQLRGQVRERLENLASRCSDLASLLRRLGVIVDGGNNPSDQQVNAAFKRALVKFHPDRVLDADPRRLVEAEETFKLINRTKKTLDGWLFACYWMLLNEEVSSVLDFMILKKVSWQRHVNGYAVHYVPLPGAQNFGVWA
ncbi:hypothetical protein AXG93_2752s1130 [Marchantia polymorpha subsp. ruderalis]|uniref:J domain-containing protein n=1 Tax=Marchantia polymorpha subsp. ruderalis TaxID=1480154 RepID=A0A176VTJ0_MARPO|nr:hypothetical protein AXG93_2752s1130 [Marchantia polymorpha subsp. ruderalis]